MQWTLELIQVFLPWKKQTELCLSLRQLIGS